jgi:hypothetical protein
MKYLVEVEYIIFDNKWADTLIVTSVKDYSKADYKIRQYLQKKYQNLTDIHINSFDFIENVTIK